MVERVALMAATVVLVAVAPVVVFALLELRRMAAESRQLMAAIKDDLVPLIRELRETTEQAGGLIQEVREGFESTSLLWGALSDLGESVQRARTLVREKRTWLARLLGWAKAATTGIRKGHNNGEQS